MGIRTVLKTAGWLQLQHDDRYHKDIWVLSVSQRLKHMIMHFSKYSASLLEAAIKENYSDYEKKLVDTLIIVFSSANTVNLDLNSFVSSEDAGLCPSIDDLARKYRQDYIAHSGLTMHMSIAVDIAISTGAMHKAIESLDHFELYPCRETTNINLEKLFKLALIGLSLAGKNNIIEAIGIRMTQVEKKHRYNEFLGNYSDEYR